MKNGNKFYLAVLAAVLAPVVPAIMIRQSQSLFARISDLPEYYAAARLLLEQHGACIYDLVCLGAKQHALFPAMGQRVVGLYVPPPGLPWLSPLSILSPVQAQYYWLAVLVFAVLASLLLLARLFRLTATEVLVVWAVISVSGPLYESLRLGQIAPLLLFAFCACLWALKANRPLLAALSMCFFLLKPHELLPFIAYLAGAGRWRPLIYLAVLACVFAGMAFYAIGQEGYHNYMQLLAQSVTQTSGMQPELCPTIRGQLLRAFPGFKQLVTEASSLICLFVLSWIWWSGRIYGRCRQWIEIALLSAVPAGLVSSLHCHDYDLLLLIPSAVVALKTGIAGGLPTWLKLAGIFGTTLLLLPLYTFIHYDHLLAGGLLNPIFLFLLVLAIVFNAAVYSKRFEFKEQVE